MGERQLADLLLRGVLGRREQVGLVIGIQPQMLYFLLAIQHLPALNAEHFPVGLGFYRIESHDELIPLVRVALQHLGRCPIPESLVCLGLLRARFFCGQLFLL